MNSCVSFNWHLNWIPIWKNALESAKPAPQWTHYLMILDAAIKTKRAHISGTIENNSFWLGLCWFLVSLSGMSICNRMAHIHAAARFTWSIIGWPIPRDYTHSATFFSVCCRWNTLIGHDCWNGGQCRWAIASVIHWNMPLVHFHPCRCGEWRVWRLRCVTKFLFPSMFPAIRKF